MSDDDNERDPFNFRYARADNLVPEYNYSDRDQRHRFNAWLLVTQKGIEFNTRVSARSAQPKSVGNTPQDRIQPDGSIIKRNTLRKDNEFFTWDIRVVAAVQAAGFVGLDRTDLRGVQPDQQQEHPPPRSDEPDLQLRRHGPDWVGRSEAGTTGRPGEILADQSRSGLGGAGLEAPPEPTAGSLLEEIEVAPVQSHGETRRQ